MNQDSFHCFSHQAMRSPLHVWIPHEQMSREDALAITRKAFEEVDQLENELSRFRPHTDLARLSRLQAGQSMPVSLAVFDCLSLAKALWEETNGAFDITVGPIMQAWRTADGKPRQPSPTELTEARKRCGSDGFELDPDTLRVTVKKDHMVFDPGAIGKGYAVDQVVQMLEEFGISAALVNFGDSTVYAHGKAPEQDHWPVELEDSGLPPVFLTNQALSGSSLKWRGNHIINPRTGDPLPLRQRPFWAMAPTATLSDAVSTAFMVMSSTEIATFCEKNPVIQAFQSLPTPSR
jgi:FAD:protein FMN transferase